MPDAFHFGIAAGKQHSKRNGLDFGNAGRQWGLQRRRCAERHQRALVAIGRRRLVRAARHVFGHGGRITRHRRHRHRCRRARIRPRRERGDDEADDHKDRQQPAKVDRTFHLANFAQPGPDGKQSSITKSRVCLTYADRERSHCDKSSPSAPGGPSSYCPTVQNILQCRDVR